MGIDTKFQIVVVFILSDIEMEIQCHADSIIKFALYMFIDYVEIAKWAAFFQSDTRKQSIAVI